MAALLAVAVVAGLALGGCKGNAAKAVDAAPDSCTPTTGCAEACNPGNNLGCGRYCTAGGGECNQNGAPFLFCTEDYEPNGTGVGFCTGPCSKDADCGDGAFCSGSGMGSKGCVPAACGGMPTM
jgi:hypothetical protein